MLSDKIPATYNLGDLKYLLSRPLTRQSATAIITRGLNNNPVVKMTAIVFINRCTPEDLERYRIMLLDCITLIENKDEAGLIQKLQDLNIPMPILEKLLAYARS
jgi:uncharacterized radical SAM superfamily Fe-S cluster-containing enzyme